MKFIFSYLKKYSSLIALTLFLKVLGTIGELTLPYILEHMIDAVAPTKSLQTALFWGSVMVVMAILTRVLNVAANRRGNLLACRVTYEMRGDLFCHSVGLSGNQTDSFGLPSITSRMTSDSYNIQNFIRAVMAMGVRAPILMLGGIVITMTMDVGMASVLAVIAPLVTACVILISVKGIPLFDRVQSLLDRVTCVMRENITGILVVKSLSKENHERARFGEANDSLTSAERKATIVMGLPGPIMNFFLNIGLSVVVLVGAYRVNGGLAKPGVILAFLTYFNLILNGAMGLNRIFMMTSKANASANRIEEIVSSETELKVIPEAAAAKPRSNAHIVFDAVSFGYGESGKLSDAESFDGEERRLSLSDISFEIARGGSLGIIGATGSGKTTVVNLLMRFYDATEGHVFVDGRDVRTYPLQELRRKFGVVFQNDIIFADTIAENIRFGRDLDIDRVADAARDACAEEFILDYEDTYEHEATIRGSNLSGGQKQRLLIARALAGTPEILIFDDASSALDYRTDAALRRAVRDNYGECTTVIIAQRISSIMSSERILILDEGKLLGYGTHEELLESCGMYREIYEAQMGEE